jgi:hypothetical protein
VYLLPTTPRLNFLGPAEGLRKYSFGLSLGGTVCLGLFWGCGGVQGFNEVLLEFEEQDEYGKVRCIHTLQIVHTARYMHVPTYTCARIYVFMCVYGSGQPRVCHIVRPSAPRPFLLPSDCFLRLSQTQPSPDLRILCSCVK